MSSITPKYGLVKPELEDNYDIDTMNGNMDSIETALAGLEESKAALEKNKADIAWAVNTFSNPNLLINGDFQVWQRGTEFPAGKNEYTADRWYKTGNAAVQKIAKGARFDLIGRYNYVQYYIEKPEIYALKKCTLSTKVSNAAGYIAVNAMVNNEKIAEAGFNIKQDGFYKSVFQFPPITEGDKVSLSFLTPEGACMDFEYVKLEYGEEATPNAPRPYAQELVLCQRYFEKTRGVRDCIMIGRTEQQITGGGNFLTEKRIPPKVILKSVTDITPNGSGEIDTGILTMQETSVNSIGQVISYSQSPFAAGHIYAIEYEADAEI